MRVSNEPGGPSGPTSAFAELFRLQSDFQARLAEETLRYLRRLQGTVVPAAPGTVVMPEPELELRAEGAPGAQATLTLEIENLQRMHCMVTPQLTPLVAATGVTWFPATESTTSSKLVAPNTVERLTLPMSIPKELPAGEYRGALLLQGFRKNSLPVAITVIGNAAPPSAKKSAPTPPKPTAKPKKGKRSPRPRRSE
jgi:hypothetical protein